MHNTRASAALIASSLWICACGGGGHGGGAPASDASLVGLTASAGALNPHFDPAQLTYGVDVGSTTASTTITATAADSGATVTVEALVTPSGTPSAPIPLPMGLTPVTIVVTARDGTARTYTVVFDRTFTSQQAYVKASNPEAGAAFGISVAISGDTLVVGAYGEDSTSSPFVTVAPYSGAAYVFVRSGSAWTQQAILKAPNSEFDDEFGYAVAISGDTLAIGARGESSSATGVDGNQADNSEQNAGAVYVFVRSGTTWSLQAYLKASNTEAFDNFGSVVALSGDTLVVGAEGEDSAATGVNGDQADNSADFSGAAYVFVRSGTTWSQQAYLKASNTGAVDGFGHCVAISGDTLVVGALAEDSAATGINGNQASEGTLNSGAAYVFVRSGTTWSQQAYLKASNTGYGDRFGYSVAISEDTLVVGAYDEGSAATGVGGDQADESAPNSGAAYVFVRSGTTWSQQAYLKASNTEALDNFGCSVALSGDTLVVSASLEASAATGVDGDQADNSARFSGAAYLFLRSGTSWGQVAYLKASNTDAYDRFGYSVAVSGDTVVVGADGESSAAPGVNGNEADDSMGVSGAVYVFR